MSRLHDVFHVSMLRKYIPDPSHVLEEQPIELAENLTYVEQPVQILDWKTQVLRTREIPLVKVLWRSHNVEEATWEPEDQMREQYPYLFDVNRSIFKLGCTDFQTLAEAFGSTERYALWDDDRISMKRSTMQANQPTKQVGQKSNRFTNKSIDQLAEECRSNIPKALEQYFQGANRQDYGDLHKRYSSQSSSTSRPHQESCRSIQPAPKIPHEVEPKQVHIWGLIQPILGYLITQRGIEAHPNQIKVILNMKSPATTKEIQSITGRAATLD
ncbi:unnamed protein product [Prunus brigantina]